MLFPMFFSTFCLNVFEVILPLRETLNQLMTLMDKRKFIDIQYNQSADLEWIKFVYQNNISVIIVFRQIMQYYNRSACFEVHAILIHSNTHQCFEVVELLLLVMLLQCCCSCCDVLENMASMEEGERILKNLVY
ncbi:unnamed protein product [Vicia faba]|uniref:Uncharacterized protein n=1 Tax=Vicia faba TaxID=3906 RepID=A0AAV1ANX6_VICFA|nr:unnamed protein product [Vicia faba]